MSTGVILLIVFLTIVASMIFLIVYDDNNIKTKKNKKDNEPIKWVYDGVPLSKCERCGGRAIIVGTLMPNKKLLWSIRCRDCSYGLKSEEDLGLVMHKWNMLEFNYQDASTNVKVR
jgi:hypothetical protein